MPTAWAHIICEAVIRYLTSLKNILNTSEKQDIIVQTGQKPILIFPVMINQSGTKAVIRQAIKTGKKINHFSVLLT